MTWLTTSSAIVLSLLLGACQTTAEQARQDNESACRSHVANRGPLTYRQCLAELERGLRVIAATAGAGEPGPGVVVVPTHGPGLRPIEPLPSILPQQVRCRSVRAAGGVQTVCQ